MAFLERAWRYCRTSTDEEDGQQDIAAQEIEVTHAAEARGFEVVGGSSDDGVTGDSDPTERPAFKEAMQAVRDGRADVIVLRDAPRFSRQPAIVATLAWRQVEASHIPVVSLAEPQLDGRRGTWVDGELQEDPTGDLVLHITFLQPRSYLLAVRKGTSVAMKQIKLGLRKTKSGKPVGAPRKVSEDEASKAAILMRPAGEAGGLGFSLRQAAHRLSEDRGAFRTTDSKLRRERTISHQALADALDHYRFREVLSKNPTRSETLLDQGGAGAGLNGPVLDQGKSGEVVSLDGKGAA